MALFSRRTTTIAAGCALVLPLAAGAADAAFDSAGADRSAGIEDAQVTAAGSVSSTDATGSVESPAGHGTADADEGGIGATACAAKQRPCASVRATTLPTVQNEQLVEVETVDADAVAEASRHGASVSATATALREDAAVTAHGSPDGGSVDAETPFGDGSGELDLDGSIAAGASDVGR